MRSPIYRSKPTRFFLLAGAVLFLVSLACSIDFGNDADASLALEQTRTALQMTQIALEEPASADGEQTQPPAPDQGAQPPAQDAPASTEEPDLRYEGISFSYDENIAAGVFPETIPGQNMGEEVMAGETYPTHAQFTFDAYAVADHFHTPRILVYPVGDYRAISDSASSVIDSLQQTLTHQPAGGSRSDLPFLPQWPAAQMLSAKVAYFDFQNGSGVRYLTMYGQAIYPVDNQNLFYTYQGLTDDGRYYVAAVLPVQHLMLPDDGETIMGDYLTFENNWESYLADTLAMLNAQEPDTFFPDIDQLDAMMASFQISP